MNQLELLDRQARGIAQNQVRAAQADIRRSTSIVNQAHRLFTPARVAPIVTRTMSHKSGVYTATAAAEVVSAPDGYVRKSPVQEIRVDAGYKKRMVKRAVAIIAGILVATLLIYLLFDVVKIF